MPTFASPSLPACAAALVVACALGGCAGSSPGGAGSRPVDAAASLAASMTVERQWLASWFKGTPVVIAQRRDGAITVDVPREFCFDPGRTAVKPALAAVLDKVAESMRRVPATQLAWLAAPDDANGGGPLAVQRASQVRDHLRGRGVAPVRLGKASVATAPAVQLRIEGPAP